MLEKKKDRYVDNKKQKKKYVNLVIIRFRYK